MLKLLTRAVLSLGLALLPVQTAVPVDKEPRHHLKFANPFVRVIDAQVPVGDATLFHTHAADNVPVTISGGKLKTELMGQTETFSTVETGSVRYAKGTYTHRITNVGETPLRFIDVEVLTPLPEAAKAASLDGTAGHKLIFENERVRVFRLIIEPGQQIEPHAHSAHRLMVVVQGGRLSFGSQKAFQDFVPGQFSWHEAEVDRSMKNVDNHPFEAVDIELK